MCATNERHILSSMNETENLLDTADSSFQPPNGEDIELEIFGSGITKT